MRTKDFNMIAYCDLNPWLEIDLKEFTFKRDGVWIKNRPFSEPIVNNSFSYLHEFESVFSYDNIMNIDFTTSHISNVLTSISKDSEQLKLESLRNTYKSAATAYKKKRIKYNVRSKLTFNKEETNVINFKQKKEAGN